MTMGTATAMAAKMNPNRTVRSRLLQQQQQQPRLLQQVLMAVPPGISDFTLFLDTSKIEVRTQVAAAAASKTNQEEQQREHKGK